MDELTTQIAGMRPVLREFTWRFTKDREESLDLVQDTILKALAHKDKFRSGTNLKGWMFTIMRNTFINQYRRSKVTKTMRDTSDDLRALNVEDIHTFNRPAESVEFKEIWRGMNSVRDEFLIPFKMYITGYKYHEIAFHLGIPIGTVKNRIFQARKEVQKRLLGYN